MATKTEVMERVERGLVHETFLHSEEGWFDITLMRAEAIHKQRKKVLLPVFQMVAALRRGHVIDEDRVNYFIINKTADPAIMIEYPDNTHLLCDGVHRILAAHRLNLPVYPAWRFTEREIIRPPANFGHNAALDWGNRLIVNGKIGD